MIADLKTSGADLNASVVTQPTRAKLPQHAFLLELISECLLLFCGFERIFNLSNQPLFQLALSRLIKYAQGFHYKVA